MKIVIAGGSGFVGTALVSTLDGKHEVVVLTRGATPTPGARTVQWDPAKQGVWQEEVAAADAVINLAGANIGDGRWTDERKKVLRNSRIDATRALVDAVLAAPGSERVFLNASAIGIYGDRGDETLAETSPPGSDFLARLCVDWEAEAARVAPAARLVIPRIGVVFGPGGGALPKMALPFRLFAGGPVGNGRQWVSWIDRRDLVRLLVWLLESSKTSGTYNATSPQPVTSRELAGAIGRRLGRPSFMPTPGFALRLALGEMADALLLAGQKVVPERALDEGFTFEYPAVADSLQNNLD